MKTIYLMLAVFLISLFSSYKTSNACTYAESNMTYVISQTKKAISQNDINKVKLYTYRAINALEKSKKQFKKCDCEYATNAINEGTESLKKATKATSLSKVKSLLDKALKNTLKSVDYLVEHGSHKKSRYGDNVLAMNTKADEDKNNIKKKSSEKSLYTIVDESLVKYETSLNKIVNTVDCKEARAFANRIYLHCEQQLLTPNLTEGKKYYNLRTKEITAEALETIGDCDAK